MANMRQFAVSSNGDRWYVGEDPATEQVFVLHRANASSGGHETRTSVEAFMAESPGAPERAALRAVMRIEAFQNDSVEREDEKTASLKLAEEYMRLGGRRRVKIDDNLVTTRQWENDTAEAAAFWKENIEAMADRRRHEVEVHLRSITDP